MAEKRMISKVISISKKFNLKLNDHFTRLLYMMLIPHADDFGRLTGCPHKVKALVIPMISEEWEIVDAALFKMHNAELIVWYEIDGEQYIQITNFDDHQQGLHKRTKSKFPEPPVNSRKFPEIPSELKGRELNRTELKGTETEGKGTEMPAPDSNPHKDRIFNLIRECEITDYNLNDLDNIYSFIGVVDIEVIEAAVKKSQGKKGSYVTGTLKGMMKDGITKATQLRQFQVLKGGNADAKHGTGHSGYTDEQLNSFSF